MKRAFKIHFSDGTSKELELSKVTSVNTTKSMINLDQMPDGRWRLIYDEKTIPDITLLTGFSIIRED